MPTNADITQRFAALAPWQSRFEVNGRPVGGDIDYSTDPRVPTFFSWFGQPRTILELGSFEGSHTLQLAAPDTTEQVLGLEGRPDNVERARLVAELLGRGNIEFMVCDLELVDLSRYGRFDAIFCAALLYHLPAPWRLLGEASRITDRLFLDAHHWDGEEVLIEGHKGGWFQEGDYTDPLSGLSKRSFCSRDTP